MTVLCLFWAKHRRSISLQYMSKPHDRTPLVSGDQPDTAPTSSSSSSDFQAMADNEAGQVADEAGNGQKPSSNSNDEPPVPEQTAWIFSIVMICISCGVAVATNLWIDCILAFGVNYLVFAVYAWPFHTEKIYDFTGMLTFLTLDLFSFFYNSKTLTQTRSIVTFCMPLVWTLRLGMCSYCFMFCFVFFFFFCCFSRLAYVFVWLDF